MFTQTKDSKAYLIGGGIASLSAAFHLIHDGKFEGKNIKIFDESQKFGGSLDALNLSESEGYVMRGIRMFEEETFTCTYDLMSNVPSLTAPGKTLREEFVEFNTKNKCYSKSRLLKNHEAIDGRPLRLNIKDRINLFTILFKKESTLDDLEIKEYFTSSFFRSNFWYEFCTIFAFQPWHSLIEFRRYFIRFIQSFPNIDTLETIEIAPYNQYESLILPIIDYLKKKGVEFVAKTKVNNLGFKNEENRKTVERIYFEKDNKKGEIVVLKNDCVFATLGSIVANSSIGSMKKAPVKNYQEKNAAWNFWKNITKDNPDFGRPAVFNSHINKSKWTSFTITFRDSIFFDLIEKFIHKKVTAYGGVNLVDSNWFISLVISYNPYFINQPKNVDLCWGFGLGNNIEGNFVKKKMEDCSGEEILTELVYHLGFEEYLDEILKTSICIPCYTPFVTSHFLPRGEGDRPLVIPEKTTNLAFLGQYCEIPEDVVFTVEYSIRSAQTAVYSLLNLNKKVSPIYQGTHHIKVLYNALKTVFR